MSFRAPTQPGSDGALLMTACPACATAYELEDTHVLYELEGAHLLHLQCRQCSNAVLAMVLVSSVGVSSVGVMTDLTRDDARKFIEAPAVDSDDVLSAHAFLEDDNRCRAHFALL